MIGLNLCPFAAQPFLNDTIEFTINAGNSTEQHLHQLAECFTRLDNDTEIETSLILYPDAYQQFDDYLDLLSLTNGLLEDLKYTGIYQIASFHPDYRFADTEEDDAANFSNRSPYPMLHLLRESSLESAIASYSTGHSAIEQIPESNIKKLREIGYEEMQAKLINITR